MINYGYIRTSKLTNDDENQKKIISSTGFDDIEYIVDVNSNDKLLKILNSAETNYRIIIASEICLSGSYNKRIEILKIIQQKNIELLCNDRVILLNADLFKITDYISYIGSLQKR